MTDRGRVLGLGGVFIKSPDPDRLKAWYRDVLGFALDDYGVNFSLSDQDGYQLWSPFKADTDYFAPSTRDVMLNFRVDDLDALLVRILAAGGEMLGDVQEEPYGKFAWLVDPDGTKIELWQQTGDSG
ncbi:VOC family protein [Aquidulcibacter sp.]|uniref:VOC family protein n=1 Tax=Aquidulcibacter sp. TaxID=2052990 RepID=UPI0025C3604D|nr:VOC family protein [Aquidulcibacter sp.]MCA3696263.1 VOC family protein [Aquidulcibacter sp.]